MLRLYTTDKNTVSLSCMKEKNSTTQLTPLEYHDVTQIFKLLVTMTLIWKILTGGDLEATGVTGAGLME